VSSPESPFIVILGKAEENVEVVLLEPVTEHPLRVVQETKVTVAVGVPDGSTATLSVVSQSVTVNVLHEELVVVDFSVSDEYVGFPSHPILIYSQPLQTSRRSLTILT
jgi:hypothetical protein